MSIFWAYVRFRILLWALRMTGRLLAAALLAAVLVAAAPVTLVAGLGYVGAWLRGWPPARLRRAAAWSLPMTAVYLAGRDLHTGTWQALALAPCVTGSVPGTPPPGAASSPRSCSARPWPSPSAC